MGAEMQALVSVGMGVAQGAAGYSAKTTQGAMYEADAIRIEGEAAREASRIEDEGRRFADEQKMSYIGSGVEIGGSAVVTLAQTDKWAATEAQNVRDRGAAMRDYYNRAGKIARREGKAAFISGIAGGIAQGFSMYSMTKAPGIQGTNVSNPYATGRNPATAKQLARPGATTRIRP